MPLVEVDGLYGQAVAYTRSYGLITWRDSDRVQRMEWFLPATFGGWSGTNGLVGEVGGWSSQRSGFDGSPRPVATGP